MSVMSREVEGRIQRKSIMKMTSYFDLSATRDIRGYINTITHTLKVSGPYVETLCVFFCIKIIISAEMWA